MKYIKISMFLCCISLIVMGTCSNPKSQQKNKQVIQAAQTQEAQAKELAELIKAQNDKLLSKLRESLTLTLIKKGYSPADTDNNQYQDYITFGVSYQNNFNKDIRAFQGTLEIQDLFGENILNLGIKIMDPVKAGKTANWNGTLKFNQFKDEDVRFKSLNFKDIKGIWIPEKIIFSDGTTLPD